MADEAITECEQCGVGVLNPGLHDRWQRGRGQPTAPAPFAAVTLTPNRQRPPWSA